MQTMHTVLHLPSQSAYTRNIHSHILLNEIARQVLSRRYIDNLTEKPLSSKVLSRKHPFHSMVKWSYIIINLVLHNTNCVSLLLLFVTICALFHRKNYIILSIFVFEKYLKLHTQNSLYFFRFWKHSDV